MQKAKAIIAKQNRARKRISLSIEKKDERDTENYTDPDQIKDK